LEESDLEPLDLVPEPFRFEDDDEDDDEVRN
jgi:hypothetical protein